MESEKTVATKTQRNSNLELFRIVATLLVLVVHFNGWFVGGMPNSYSLSTLTVHESVQLYIESLSCCCVNCFLIISGWYGVKLKFRSVWKLWLILIGVYIPCFIIECYISRHIDIRNLVDSVVAFSRESYYIQNYLVLLLISPVLNSFIEKYGNKVTQFALSLFSIEFLMEYLCDNQCLYIKHGYSLFHFVTIYFLSRAAYLNKDVLLKLNGNIYLIGYFAFAFLIAVYGLVAKDNEFAFAYSCPLNIIESFCLFFFFAKLNFNNKTVNYIASGTLTVYVLQITSPVIWWLMKLDKYLLNNFSYAQYLLIAFSAIVVFFLISILYAKIVEKILGFMFTPLGNYMEKKTANFFIC